MLQADGRPPLSLYGHKSRKQKKGKRSKSYRTLGTFADSDDDHQVHLSENSRICIDIDRVLRFQRCTVHRPQGDRRWARGSRRGKKCSWENRQVVIVRPLVKKVPLRYGCQQQILIKIRKG